MQQRVGLAEPPANEQDGAAQLLIDVLAMLGEPVDVEEAAVARGQAVSDLQAQFPRW